MTALATNDLHPVEARNSLVESNIPLARWVARQHVHQARGIVDLDDLQQAAMVGLIRAAELFDANRGTTFATYAVHWCRQAVRRTIANQGRTIRVPAHLVRVPEAGEELTPRQRAAEAANRTASLTAVGDDARAVADPRPSPHDLAAQEDEVEWIRSRVNALPADLADVVRGRFGLGRHPETLKAIGHRAGISREHAGRRLASALEALRR